MVYVDLPGTPECPNISKDHKIAKSKNNFEKSQHNKEENGNSDVNMSSKDLNDNQTIEIPEIFTLNDESGKIVTGHQLGCCPESESGDAKPVDFDPVESCRFRRPTVNDRDECDAYPEERLKNINETRNLLNNESNCSLSDVNVEKDSENNSVSNDNLIDHVDGTCTTEMFRNDGYEIEIIPEYNTLESQYSPLHRVREKNSPKLTTNVALNLPETPEADNNSKQGNYVSSNPIYNFETSVTQFEPSVLDSPISVSDYVDRTGESNDMLSLPHCFLGGFDVAKDSKALPDFETNPFDDEDYDTTIIVQEGDDDDSVIILQTEQTMPRSGYCHRPPTILWTEPRLLSSLSDVSLIDVEDPSLWRDCSLLKDCSPSLECSPFKDFSSLNDFSLMGETSPSPLQNVSPLENSSLLSTRDNSPSRENNPLKEIYLHNTPMSPVRHLHPLTEYLKTSGDPPLYPARETSFITDKAQEDVPNSPFQNKDLADDVPGTSPNKHTDLEDTVQSTSLITNKDMQNDVQIASPITDTVPQDTVQTSIITTKEPQKAIPTIITSSADDTEPTKEQPTSPHGCFPNFHEKESPKLQEKDLLPFGTDKNKSRGILASCQVPKSVAEVPEAFLNLKETHKESPLKHPNPLKSKVLNETSKGNSWRDFKMDPSEIVSTLVEPYQRRCQRESHMSKSPKKKGSPCPTQLQGTTCDGIEIQEPGKEEPTLKGEECESFGPRFFADLCSLWPDIIVRLAHDISLESPSVEDAPDPPDPPSIDSERRQSCDGEEGSLQSPRPQPNSPRPQPEGKCCSDEDPCCPQLMAEHTSELRASVASTGSPKRQVLLTGPCISAGLQPATCPSPICGSPAPRRPRPMSSSGPSSVESVESTDTGDLSTGEFFSGELEDLLEATTSPDGDLDGTGRSSGSWDQKPNERKRRKLPEIPKNKKSFSTASILALRSGPTLAEELHEAESGVASRSSTPDALTLINNHSRPILVLKCHSYIRDDSSSPDSELRLPINDIDSGNSTQHSPDGAKSMSPQATVNESLSPMSPGSGGVPFPQLELLEATHRGLYRFIPRHHDEVEIEIGDPIYVQKEADDLWCEGVNLRTGRQGIFPGAHVTDVDYSDFDPSVPKVKKERYLLNYLGSIETLCHKGNQVLCQAVRKIAGGEESVQHPHPCILEVSDQGIRMVDKSKPGPNHVPCHDYFYHLKHVSFCAFHPKDHRYFGFITKHPTIQRFACHVFRSNDSTRPVAEAVGRAFQRFYQKFIETAYPIEDIYLE